MLLAMRLSCVGIFLAYTLKGLFTIQGRRCSIRRKKWAQELWESITGSGAVSYLTNLQLGKLWGGGFQMFWVSSRQWLCQCVLGPGDYFIPRGFHEPSFPLKDFRCSCITASAVINCSWVRAVPWGTGEMGTLFLQLSGGRNGSLILPNHM